MSILTAKLLPRFFSGGGAGFGIGSREINERLRVLNGRSYIP